MNIVNSFPWAKVIPSQDKQVNSTNENSVEKSEFDVESN